MSTHLAAVIVAEQWLKRSTNNDFTDPEKLRLVIAELNQYKEGRERPEEPTAEAAVTAAEALGFRGSGV